MRSPFVIASLFMVFGLSSSARQSGQMPSRYIPVEPERLLQLASSKVDPIYPPDALKAGTTGVVRLYVVVNADGSVARTTIQSGDVALAAAAKAALDQWRFKPQTAGNGLPSAVGSTVYVSFSSDGKAAVIPPTVDVFRAIVKAHPEDAGAHFDLARALTSKGDLDGAVEEGKAAVAAQPRNPQYHWDLAGIYWKRQEWRNAAEEYRASMQNSTRSDNGSAQLEVARSLERAGAWDESFANFREVLQKYPTRPDTLMFYGEALYRKGDAQQADAAFRDLLVGRGDAAKQHGALCGALTQGDDVDAAMTQCKEALNPPPSDNDSSAMAHHWFGVVQEKRGDTGSAFAEYRVATDLMPSVPLYRADFQRLQVFLVDPLLPAANSGVPQTHETSADAATLVSSAITAFQNHDYKSSYDLARKAQSADPQSQSAIWIAGAAAFASKDYPGAIALYKKYAELVPDNWRAQIQLIRSYQMAGMSKERDVARETLLALRRSGTDTSLNGTVCYVMDQFSVQEKLVRVTTYFELAGRFAPRYYFDVFNSATRRQEIRVALESDDFDQPSFAKEHPQEAAKGARRFSMDTYQENSHGTVRFFDGEPNYDEVRGIVMQFAQGAVKPVTSSSKQ